MAAAELASHLPVDIVAGILSHSNANKEEVEGVFCIIDRRVKNTQAFLNIEQGAGCHHSCACARCLVGGVRREASLQAPREVELRQHQHARPQGFGAAVGFGF